MKKVLFVINSISAGGAERLVQYLLNGLDRSKFEIELCIFKEDTRKVVPKDVKVYVLKSKFHIIRAIKESDPDLIVSFLWTNNILCLLANIFTKKPIYTADYTYMSLSIREYRFPIVWRILIALLYRRADKHIVVSEAVKKDLSKYFFISKDKITVIHSAIDVEEVERLSNEYEVNEGTYVLSCGRLAREKNFKRLIDGVESQKTFFPDDIKLVIIGEGKKKEELIEYAKEKNVKLILPGYIDNVYPWFKNAGVFALTSCYEGMPLVVLEAMACKTSVVALDILGGVDEIIENGTTGTLLHEWGEAWKRDTFFRQELKQGLWALSRALYVALKSGRHVDYGIRDAYNMVKEKFNIDKMIKEYENKIKD